MDPLMPVDHLDAVDGGSEATGKVELPYSELLQMQLEREEQSHQEACDKYGKVCVVWMVWLCCARDAQEGVIFCDILNACACACVTAFGCVVFRLTSSWEGGKEGRKDGCT